MVQLRYLLAFAVLVACINLSQQDCPLSSKMTSCSPKCLHDTECSTLGGKCCPNICNTKSCVLNRGTADKYASGNKATVGGGAGSYCGNVKCNSYEKCDMDRATKRQKCVRS